MMTGASAPATDPPESGTTARPRKRAVVVIHGIGNQSPMATLRQFVESVWTTCTGLVRHLPPRTWSKRDLMSNNYELHRITTNEDTSGRRTDFFEFYWADQMEDTQLADVIWWLQRLFVRRPARVPPAVREAWLAGIVALVLFAAAVVVFAWLALDLLHIVPSSTSDAFWLLVGLSAIALGFWFIRHVVLIQVVGDAARYLTASPPNIAARSRIRTSGITLLEALHRDTDYDRIIFVCHSLGTVIGYDVLNFYWSTINGEVRHDPADSALLAIERATRDLRAAPDDADALLRFREAQRQYATAVRADSNDKWKVTDFVTLGSPLTHAHLLLVDDRDKLLDSDRSAIEAGWLSEWRRRLDPTTRNVAELLSARMAQREFPTCPPLSDSGDRFTYRPTTNFFVVPHHAAVFAPVRWTNIYAPCRHVLWGDVIGGPVARLFGPGVKDVPLDGGLGSKFFAHTHYWDQGLGDDEHLDALRNAINLLDEY